MTQEVTNQPPAETKDSFPGCLSRMVIPGMWPWVCPFDPGWKSFWNETCKREEDFLEFNLVRIVTAVVAETASRSHKTPHSPLKCPQRQGIQFWRRAALCFYFAPCCVDPYHGSWATYNLLLDFPICCLKQNMSFDTHAPNFLHSPKSTDYLTTKCLPVGTPGPLLPWCPLDLFYTGNTRCLCWVGRRRLVAINWARGTAPDL